MYIALPSCCSKRHMLDIERIRQLIKVYEEMRDSHPKDSLEHEALDYRIRELTEKIKNFKVVQTHRK
jgi:hypothetical protein